ncbi:MAG: lipopolysaccharide biosynthesis protein [Rubrivivax sp.]|jgi:uncharacterized protein involved in exopolysaccharide biosynthesis|nr:lipopolysaccharide biosynthesis protein [Rubrivivax sp.]MCA3258338.1 lipopolysaccharide biosynthesis protein [Rubrivivax sp.]
MSVAATSVGGPESPQPADPTVADLFVWLLAHWKRILAAGFVAGLLGLGGSYLVPPTYTGKATFLLPQQQGAGQALLASLGGLAALAEGVGGARTPADQYAALMQSTTVADRMVDHFKLREIYDVKLRADARRRLDERTRILIGRRDGVMTVEVDDHDPKRAADMANQYVEELRGFSSRLAMSEAQQRRAFFEVHLKQARDELSRAQLALQGAGLSAGVLRAEPRAAADSYARLRAEVGAAEVRLQTLLRSLTENAPEVQRSRAQLDALRAHIARAERVDGNAGSSDYLARYRDFKYYETLTDLFSRQYEMARVDEAREGPLIQVIDVAAPPERKSSPRRAIVALICAAAGVLIAASTLLVRNRRMARPI